MASNTMPIFSKVGDIQWAAALLTANTAKDGTGTVSTIFTADATNGGYVKSIRAKAIGTNTASVMRVFVNNGSANSTPANNTYYDDQTLPATTLSEVAALVTIEVPMQLALPPGYKLNITIGTTVASGWVFTAVGGKF